MSATERDPTDLLAIEREEAEQQRRNLAVAAVDDGDLVWLLSGPQGRRIVRRWLRAAGIGLRGIASTFHSNYGQMCLQEGRQEMARAIYAQLLRLLATGHLPAESHRRLMTERDDG